MHPDHVESLIEARATSRGPWSYTDDTEMALAVYEVLVAHHGIDRDALARRFAERYVARPDRGYGPAAHAMLQRIASGDAWREAAGEVFGGARSYGNGGAMRAAPVGAYFFATSPPSWPGNARDLVPASRARSAGSSNSRAFPVEARERPFA